MAEITLSIPNPQLPRIISAIKGIYTIPQIPDPNFIGDPTEAPQVNQFTDNQWVKERIRRFLIDTVKSWELRVATENARKNVIIDNSLVS